MKAFRFGIAGVAILLVSACIGFGIAQAGGTHSEQPVLSFKDMDSFERGGSSSSYVESRPVLAFQDSSSSDAESRPVLSFEEQENTHLAKSPSEDMQLENPIETGAIPATGSEEPWMKDYGQD